MATSVRYIGPPDQRNDAVGQEIEGSVIMEPGKTYDLSADLAKGLVSSSSFWERVGNLDDLTLDNLRDKAKSAGLEGYSAMKKDELVAALRGKD